MLMATKATLRPPPSRSPVAPSPNPPPPLPSPSPSVSSSRWSDGAVGPSTHAACTPTPPTASGAPSTTEVPRSGGTCVPADGPLGSTAILLDASSGHPASASPPTAPSPVVLVAKSTPAQGFLTKRLPGFLALDPQALPHPFSTPGVAFLQFTLENLSSLVCSLVAPGSLLFATSTVFIAVSHGDHQPTQVSSVRS
nr:uncharacterized protein LOC127318331 [Lolium perenne]